MSAPKADPKQAKFIAGMKGPNMDPDELAKRLKAYLKHEARLSDLLRQQIFRTPLIKPKAKLETFIRTYKPNRPDVYEESEARVLVTQASDMVDEIGSAIENFDRAEKIFADQQALGATDSLVFKTGQECVAYLSKSNAALKKTVKSVSVPKPIGKPEVTVKEVYAAASVLITAAVLVAEVSRRVAEWQKKHKMPAA